MAWGSVVNCIVRDNVDLSLEDPGDIRHDVMGLPGMFQNNAFPSAHGSACVTADPQFKNPSAGDYRIRSTSPCRDKGLYQSWMADAVDFFQAAFRDDLPGSALCGDDPLPEEEGGNLYLINGNMLPLKQAGAFYHNGEEETTDE